MNVPNPVTIVMYHYVRELKSSRYPNIKGLELNKFEGQLEYISRHYSVVSMGDLASAMAGEKSLPKNSCILTFDDGLMDHFSNAYPLLKERDWPGCFFVSAGSLGRDRLLDVHKLHFILARVDDSKKFYALFLKRLGEMTDKGSTSKKNAEFDAFVNPRRFDDKEIAFIKDQLQVSLPIELRKRMLDALYSELGDVPESTLAKELYMGEQHIRTLVKGGMEVGGHGLEHYWLNSMGEEEQSREIQASVEVIKKAYGRLPDRWIFSYPYSGHNEITMRLLQEQGCGLALTSKPGLVTNNSKLMELERLDTNDLPKDGDADISDWTRKARLGHQ